MPLKLMPLSWNRLNPQAELGAAGLASELGPKGRLVIILDGETPIACSGVEPFRGDDWFGATTYAGTDSKHLSSALAIIEDYEICCFCIHPDYRGKGLARQLVQAVVQSIKVVGARRLISNYSVEESGKMWHALGFTIPVGKGTIIHKGFKPAGEKEELAQDMHFRMSAMLL